MLSNLEGKKMVIMASTGGHLEQAVAWSRRLKLSDESIFITFDTAQSRSLLASQNVVYVRYVPPRGGFALLGAVSDLFGKIKWSAFDGVLSSGAGFAVAGVPFAKLHRKPFYFIESVSRFHGPSLTGQLLTWVPNIKRYTQHEFYAGPKWKQAPSLMDAYHSVGVPQAVPVGIGRISVYTLT
jgi:UDP-N-acetylglucosamine--N-acetylmuramyl-(pentapeptide) pyrophosphoryl-undecaprenol N-acetylglucosamine transferase